MSVDNALSPVSHEVDPAIARAAAHDQLEPGGSAYQTLASTMRACARRHLWAGPGYFVLSGLSHLDEAAARRFLLAASGTLGAVMPHDFDGELIREVRYRGVTLEGAATARYSDTRQGGNLHTDGMHRPGPIPDYFALYCVRQAAVGGAMILVHVDDLMRALAEESEVMATLQDAVHFDTRDDTPGRPATVPRPILEITGDGARICYLREYIDSGHRRPGVPPLSPAQVRALDMVDALLDRADLQTRARLRPGELIVVNNRTVVHGRTAFRDEPGGQDRLLLRTWIARSS